MAHHKYMFQCPVCDTDVAGEFDIEPFHQGRTSGPPDRCYPSEGGYAELTEPATCPNCQKEFEGTKLELICEFAYNDWEDAQEPDEPDDDEGPPFRY